MIKIGLSTRRPACTACNPPIGARISLWLRNTMARARQGIRAVTLQGRYGHLPMSMRLDRDDVRHYARLAQGHGLTPSLAGYLEFRILSADPLLPSPLEVTVAGSAQALAGSRADRFLFADPVRAEQDFLRLLEP
ncbi:hypothetical protein M8A51_18095 [Schlegelella sp. S2-27]|uniref:Uncharacterized protein n=1 Tax=Caldimonas mangrovi TaxID=2944811 RepID=A0ABT0YRR4_9BURK|nr:hypothetical protein [Caldimonas mangrovi]MCM5681443.1 hypothetical protein [Caldimonas mangrovi]